MVENPHPTACAALFSRQDAAEEAIREAFEQSPHWREARLYRLPATGRFRADVVTDVVDNPINPSLPLVALGSRSEWLAGHERHIGMEAA